MKGWQLQDPASLRVRHQQGAALSEQAQAFVDFATSKDAADLIRTAGAVPVNEVITGWFAGEFPRRMIGGTLLP